MVLSYLPQKGNSYAIKLTKDAIEQALLYLQNALEITGDNALLYSGMSWAYYQLVNIGGGQEEELNKAEEYAK